MIRHFTKLAVFAALVFAVALPAHADQRLTILTSNGGSVVVLDGGAGDLSAQAGVITFAGSVGGLDISVSTGVSKPVLGSATAPVMDLNAVTITGPAALTVTFAHTDTDFGLFSAPGVPMVAHGGGTTQGSANYQVWLGATNTPFELTQNKANLSSVGSGAFALSAPFSICPGGCPGLLSITQVVTFQHPGGDGVISSGDFELRPVPEPETITMLGLGLTLIGATAFVADRKRKASSR